MREVLIIAGEASGDLHASGLATALKKLRPDLTLTGVGGARMESAGVALIERSDRMAVMGFVKAFWLNEHLLALQQARDACLAWLRSFVAFKLRGLTRQVIGWFFVGGHITFVIAQNYFMVRHA